MSAWTYVNGIVTVVPPGSGQRAMDFVLGEVVDHLPRVTGSEGDMHVEIIRRPGHDCSSNHDEFGAYSNLGGSWGGHWFEEQSTYDLLLSGALRDRHNIETLKEFSKWMSRLAKRVRVKDVLVRVSDCYGWSKVFDGAEPWDCFERWSWIPDGYDHSFNMRKTSTHKVRRSSNWRYGIMPDEGNWTEHLLNLLPSGNIVLHEYDEMVGNLEWYEYGQTPEEVRESFNEVMEKFDAVQNTAHELLGMEFDMKANPID